RLAEDKAGILGRRLHEQPIERRSTEDLSIRDGVERDAARETQILRTDELVREAAVVHHAALEHGLCRIRDIRTRLEGVAASGDVIAKQALVRAIEVDATVVRERDVRQD